MPEERVEDAGLDQAELLGAAGLLAVVAVDRDQLPVAAAADAAEHLGELGADEYLVDDAGGTVILRGEVEAAVRIGVVDRQVDAGETCHQPVGKRGGEEAELRGVRTAHRLEDGVLGELADAAKGNGEGQELPLLLAAERQPDGPGVVKNTLGVRDRRNGLQVHLLGLRRRRCVAVGDVDLPAVQCDERQEDHPEGEYSPVDHGIGRQHGALRVYCRDSPTLSDNVRKN